MDQRLAEIAQSCVDETVGHRLLEMYPGVKEEGLFDKVRMVLPEPADASAGFGIWRTTG